MSLRRTETVRQKGELDTGNRLQVVVGPGAEEQSHGHWGLTEVSDEVGVIAGKGLAPSRASRSREFSSQLFSPALVGPPVKANTELWQLKALCLSVVFTIGTTGQGHISHIRTSDTQLRLYSWFVKISRTL